MATNYTIKKVISTLKSELKPLYPEYEITSFISLIIEHIFNFTRVQVYTNQDHEISNKSYKKILEIIEELKAYKPLQYILGNTSFYDLSFIVNPHVLIPRQETEELVDWIIKENTNANSSILDIGTGSGCIAITLAKNILNSVVLAADISKEALSTTKQNSLLNGVDIEIMQLDILNPEITIDAKFDIIVSNPPYVTEKEKSLMHENVLNFEPESALFVPDDNPLLFYKAITDFALKYLNPEGKVYFEINEAYGREAALMLEERNFHNITLRKDINEKNRMLRAILK